MFTENGRILFEVVSALQKEIRRGNEREAMYWAMEMLPKYEAYLWRRLLVIANEDIGLANPAVVQFVTSQCQAWFAMRRLGGKDECKLVLGNAILAMCRSAKSRLADHFQCVVTHMHSNGSQLDIPDYALDKHTLRGKRMGRDMEHFLLVGAELHPQADELDDPYADEAWEIWLNPLYDPPDDEWPTPKRAKELAEQLPMNI